MKKVSNFSGVPLTSLLAIGRQMEKSGSPQMNKKANRAERAISRASERYNSHRSTVAADAEEIHKKYKNYAWPSSALRADIERKPRPGPY